MGRAVMDRRKFLAGLGAGAAVLGLGGAATRAIAAMAETGDWAGIQTFLEAYLARTSLPGGIISVGQGQEEAPHYFAAGTASRVESRAIDQDSLWRIYSMTKPITGMAAMMLIEDGAMTLDQNIADILPEFADPQVLVDPQASLESRPAARPITIRNLLTHTAGLGYTIVTTGPLLGEYQRLGLEPGVIRNEPIPNVESRPSSLAEFSERLATLPLIADPGSVWSYSVALDLMGHIIETVSGMGFDAFLQQRIFGPLGMTNSFFEVPGDKIGLLTDNHGVVEGSPPVVLDSAANSVYADPPQFLYGGAGLVSSARDYDRFLAMLLGEGAIPGVRVMESETAQLAMSNLLPEGVEMPAGLAGQGFGAAGRVRTEAVAGGEGAGTFGWGGAASTVGTADRGNDLRIGGYIQLMPSPATTFTQEVGETVYASLNSGQADQEEAA